MRKLFLVVAAAAVLGFSGCDNQSVTDTGITASVKSKMAADTETSALRINVDTANGVVTLSGVVPTQTEKVAAERIAKNTDNVRSVVNNLTVRPETVSPTATPLASGDNRDVGDTLSDAGVLAKIKAQYVAAGIIGTNVDVTNGAVLLKGEVESAAEKTQAEDIARKTEGVKSVKNTLVIKKS